MKTLSRTLWIGLFILATVALVSGGTAVYGIEGGLASLGAMTLIGMTSIVIYALAKALQRSGMLVQGDSSEYANMSATSFNGDDLKRITYSKPVEAGPITQEDKWLILEHINEFFAKGGEQSREKPVEAGTITKQDKWLIMEHIDELFAKGWEQSGENSADVVPISKEDQRSIMEHIDELFAEGREQSREKSS